MPFAEDLSVFLQTQDFATAATYQGSATVNGIFDNQYFEGMNFQGSAPVFMCRTADVASAAHGQTLAVGADTYKIVGVEPDGTGITLMRLEKQ